jgi:hypothetical protein
MTHVHLIQSHLLKGEWVSSKQARDMGVTSMSGIVTRIKALGMELHERTVSVQGRNVKEWRIRTRQTERKWQPSATS